MTNDPQPPQPDSEPVQTPPKVVHGGTPHPSGISLEDRNTAMLAHIGTLVNFFTGMGGFLVPLIIYLIKKEDSEFIATEAKESLNFQITYLLAGLAAGLLGFVTCGITWFLGVALWVAALVMPLIAGLQAKEGKPYRYPATLRLIA